MAASRRFAWIALLGCCCDPAEKDSAAVDVPLGRVAVPVADRSNRCADVSRVRVCWGAKSASDACHDSICVQPIALPTFSATAALGWRCTGSGSSRTCVDRRRHVGAFECDDGHCTQLYPRLPDDGEWTCMDSAGAVVCLGGDRAAGVVQSPKPDGWFCGPHMTKNEKPSGEERICVDFAPDLPDGQASSWSCRYEQRPQFAKMCERSQDVHRLGDACAAEAPCVDGARCIASHCVPGEPRPSCWVDADCTTSVCRFGSCVEGDP